MAYSLVCFLLFFLCRFFFHFNRLVGRVFLVVGRYSLWFSCKMSNYVRL